jgi:hypothetical protein
MNKITENINIHDNSHSPIIIRSNNVSNSAFKGTQNSNEVLSSLSPFIVKRHSFNLMNSNSNSQTKSIHENLTTGNKVYTPSPNVAKEKLSDRFIPLNKGTNLLEKFEMAKQVDNNQNNINKANNANETNEAGNLNYSALLQNNFFGIENSSKGVNNTTFKTKIFQFKTDSRKRNTVSNFKTSNLDNNDNLNFTRKVNSKPYKILDSPGLLDDFYLNLVDWSARDDIAVGLSNTVYLWCANKTQVVNLTSYDSDKYVSSVMWNAKYLKI